MKNAVRQTISILIAFAIIFTGLPMMSDGLTVQAASYWRSVKVKATGRTTATVSWARLTKKQQKKISGITVYRNDGSGFVAVKNLKKTATSFTDSGLNPGVKYTYQIKTNKKSVKKTKKWWNKKSKKWQKKKPAKKFRGKSKTVKAVKYSYKNASNPVSVKIVNKAEASKTTNSNGGTKPSVTESTSGGTTTQSGSNTMTVTDYLGVTRTLTRNVDGTGSVYWTYSDQYGPCVVSDNRLVEYDRTRNGTFGDTNGSYKQISGATFQITGGGVGYMNGSVASPKYNDVAPVITAYNVDPAKLQVTLIDATLEDVNTWSWDQDNEKVVPEVTTYVKKDGKRIATAYEGENGKFFNYKNNAITCLFFKNDKGIGGNGIFNGNYTLRIIYDGVKIGDVKMSSYFGEVSDKGMSMERRKYYAVAETAMGGASPKSIWDDYKTISLWITANITNGQSYTTEYGTIEDFDCLVASTVLETWLVYNYGEPAYGFYRGEKGGYPDHRDYCLNSDPNSAMYVTF